MVSPRYCKARGRPVVRLLAEQRVRQAPHALPLIFVFGEGGGEQDCLTATVPRCPVNAETTQFVSELLV